MLEERISQVSWVFFQVVLKEMVFAEVLTVKSYRLIH